MNIIIIEESIVVLKTLSGNAQKDLSSYIHAINAAPSIDSLESLLKDDVVRTDSGFNILVKDNYQHVTACIMVKVNNMNEATITFQAYD